MVKASRKILGAFLSLMLTLSMVPAMALPAFADEVVTSEIGTTTWTLQNGVLTIAPTNGVSGELPPINGSGYYGYKDQSGWNSDYANATKIVFAGNVSFNKLSVGAFSGFAKLEALAINDGSIISFQNDADLQRFFRGCSSLKDISVLSKWSVPGITNMSGMFDGCKSLKNILPLSNWDTSNVVDVSSIFKDCSALTDISALSEWNVSNVTKMSEAFMYCKFLQDIFPLSNWDISNVTSLYGTFHGCEWLSDITALSNWNTSNITTLSYMFYAADKLSNLSPLSAWNTSNVVAMSGMFVGCAISDVRPLSAWQTSKVSQINGMFSHNPISDISPLSSWDTSHVTDMGHLFYNCVSLSDISPISSWDMSSITSVLSMFYCCPIKKMKLEAKWTSLKNSSLWTPEGDNLTGKWVSTDAKNKGPLTTTQLTESWDPSTMAGTWVAETSDTILPTGISVSPTSFTLSSKGAARQLSATVSPSNATDKTVAWTTSNSSVAAVSSSGLVTAVANGSATITAKTSNGKAATCAVTVSIPVEATGVSISPTSATLTSKGATRQLTATVSPSNTTNKAVSWTISNSSVATVSSSGLVTAVANGSATITAKTSNGKTATCKVTVSIPVQPTGISLSPTSATLTSKGATRQLTATVSPSNAANKSVTWASSNNAVATVSSTGLVTAVANGVATITAKTSNGKTATCYVTVSIPVVATSVKINQSAFTLTKKSSYKALTATVSPSNAANKTVTWSSSNTSVAKVTSAGKVTPGSKNGTTYITARTANGKTAKVKVTVKIVYPTKITITTGAFTFTKKGAIKTVAYKLSGSGITDKTVTWTSSNTKVATVSSSGKVTAVANGTATIKAKTANGKTASVKATVKIPVVKVTSVSLSATSATLISKGATKQLTATVKPANTTNKNVTWSTSNAKVATVSSSGKVTAVANGTATITAKTADGGKTAKCKITVSITKALTNLEKLMKWTAMDEYEAQKALGIFNEYNAFRKSKGLKATALDQSCTTWAYASAKGCAAQGKLTHYLGIPSSKRPPKTISYANRNVYYYYCDILQDSWFNMTPKDYITVWSRSDGHRKMMQCTTATKAGVGVYNDGGKLYLAIVYNFKGHNQDGN